MLYKNIFIDKLEEHLFLFERVYLHKYLNEYLFNEFIKQNRERLGSATPFFLYFIAFLISLAKDYDFCQRISISF